MKRLGVIVLLPLDGVIVHGRVASSIKFARTHLSTWLERGTVRLKCPTQEHTTMSLGRVRTQTAPSEGERSINEATAPLLHIYVRELILLLLIYFKQKSCFQRPIHKAERSLLKSNDWWRNIISLWTAHLYWRLIQAFHDQQPHIYGGLKRCLSLGGNLCIQTHSIFAKQVIVRTQWKTTYKFNIFCHVKQGCWLPWAYYSPLLVIHS